MRDHRDGLAQRQQGGPDARREIATYDSIRYDITRQLSHASGVLQQHVLRIVTKNGERGGVYAAVYFGFDDVGLIARIEAYAELHTRRPKRLTLH